MDSKTIKQLNDLNNAFYEAVVDPFNSSRNAPWKGWETLIDYFKLHSISFRQVVDIGCGNGRFGSFFLDYYPNAAYLGIDSNDQLLEYAKQAIPKQQATFLNLDIVKQLLEEGSIAFPTYQTSTLYTLFGVLHHIPSQKLRQQLLTSISTTMTNHDLLVVTAWQFTKIQNLMDRRIEPSPDLNLEHNDYILDWQRKKEAKRYCHLVTQSEIESLAEAASLQIVHSYSSDGRTNNLNDYYLLQKNG